MTDESYDAWREAVREGQRRWRENLTPEDKEAMRRKGAATRAATKRRQAERDAENESERRGLERRRESNRRSRARSRGDPEEPTYVSRTVPGFDKPVPFLIIGPSVIERRSQRFVAYVDSSGGPESCWPYRGSPWHDSEYGSFSLLGTAMPAHRVAWSLAHGLLVPYVVKGERLPCVVDHLCNCKWCVNPDHLDPCSLGENNRRRTQRTPELTRTRTSFERPERWYPFGRRLYDAQGIRRSSIQPQRYDDWGNPVVGYDDMGEDIVDDGLNYPFM